MTTEQADIYFSKHLASAKWNGLTTEQKESALAMAESDILARLTAESIDETRINQLNAVYEQALFLAVNFDKLQRYDDAEAESIDGVGSKTYRKKKPLFSERAQQFLDLDRGNMGSVRIGRG
jgi:hypothetical protein